MKIHAIQTGSVRIRPNQRQGRGIGMLRLMNTLTDRRWTEPLPIYFWVIEHPEGAIVIDTGETAQAVSPGYYPAWHPYYKNLIIQETPEQEAGPQLHTLGIRPEDVRWVILTHLHTDHAGGLYHFPKAEILVVQREYELARGFAGQVRGFLPNHWPSWFAPKLIELLPKPFYVFPNSFTFTKAEDVLIVPTSGHTHSHVSVILQDSDSTFFFAGDASYTQQLMIDLKIDGICFYPHQARQTLQRIHRFAQSTPCIYLPSHDPESYERMVNKKVVTL